MLMKDDSYKELLTRIEDQLSKVEVKKTDRIEIPKAETFWIGQKHSLEISLFTLNC